jgi:hypothetical protein
VWREGKSKKRRGAKKRETKRKRRIERDSSLP